MRVPVHPIIGSTVFVPSRLLSEQGVRAIHKELLAKHFNQETNETTYVRLYKETAGGLYLPRAWVRDNLPSVWNGAIDRTTIPDQTSGIWSSQITPRNPEQAKFMAEVSALIQRGIQGEIIDTIIEASTGTGKTVAMIHGACDNDITNVLVMVHRNNLKEQWLGNIELGKGLRFFFGEEWVDKNVGIVQQDQCDWEKPVVIAMAPTLCSRRYSPEFYKRFGVIFIDEIHKFAAPVLQTSLSLFNAGVRIGATATLKKGEMAKVTTAQLGAPSIVSKQKPLQPKVIRLINKQQIALWNYQGPEAPVPNVESCDNARYLAYAVPRLEDRNEMLSEIIYHRGYSRGRFGIVLSDRVNHLMDMRQRVIDLGADPELCGLYVGEHDTGKMKLTGYSQLGSQKVHFRGLPGFDTRAKAESYARKALKGGTLHVTIKKERYKPTEEDRLRIENDCQFIFATYGIFDTGIDISRLDWGIELLPRGDVTQAIGRILRIHAGKPVPVWYSVEDHFTQIVNSIGNNVMQYTYRTPLRLAKSRLAGYNQQNAEISVIGNPRNALDKAKEAEKSCARIGSPGQSSLAA